ncbi:MAG: K(+)-transporting ATPase subunit C [Verrucomicrobiota bacterium]
MKELFTETRKALVVIFMFAVVCCGIYPMIVYGMGQAFFSHQANGSLIVDKEGVIRGSELIGQGFTGEKYFHSRPSAAGTGYDATSSGGSNFGPTSQKLHDAIRDRIELYRKENGLNENAPIPADAVTASASGLDPHISIQNAECQISRVAKARHLDENQVRMILQKNIDQPGFPLFGNPGVNVLKVNRALDSLL